MDALSVTISRDEFMLFHNIDRKLYTTLVLELFRDPVQALKIMAFWICLEQFSFRNTVSTILSMPSCLINDLAEEAATCLNCLHLATNPFPSSYHISGIPLTQGILGKGFGLQFLDKNRSDFISRLAQVTGQLCNKVLMDILKEAQESNGKYKDGETSMILPLLDPIFQMRPAELACRVVHPDDRTLFVTFFCGYPVTDREIREFFSRLYGDCTEGLHVQEVKSSEQPLYSRIVFHSASTIQNILKGRDRVKFTFNGKHAWMPKFVPKHKRSLWCTNGSTASAPQ